MTGRVQHHAPLVGFRLLGRLASPGPDGLRHGCLEVVGGEIEMNLFGHGTVWPRGRP